MAWKVQTVMPFYLMGLSAVLISLTVLSWKEWGPTLLINETASEPAGVYRLIPHSRESDYRRGMYVVFPVPQELKALVYERHWLQNGIPFLKEVLALSGDQVCVFSDRLEINHTVIGPVFQVDSLGRALPQHLGCFEVAPGTFFAASQYFDKSFDGRYFGALPLSIVTGEARAVWTF